VDEGLGSGCQCSCYAEREPCEYADGFSEGY